jgi:hypothetical protein
VTESCGMRSNKAVKSITYVYRKKPRVRQKNVYLFSLL